MSVDLGILRAVARELPDAMRPAWGAQTWAGEFGEQALRARVTSMDTVLTIGADGLTGSSKVAGEVLGAPRSPLERLLAFGRGEARRGSFGHELLLHHGGRLEAHHTRLALDRGSRGTGFGGGFVDHARARYGAAGIDDVSMFAGMSVGGYAWARQGLELATTATDDTARLLDRGRQLAAVVDSARKPIDLSGRIPHLGRRISAAEHAALEPRLVRGDTLPPDALTSMQELAGLPEVGRTILLGRMWKGTAEIDRTATWWARNGEHTAAQAASGVSWRTKPELVAAESIAAARRVASALPAAADPFRAGATFATHVGVGDAIDGARAVLRTGLDEAIDVRTTIPVRTPAGRTAELTVTWDGTTLAATERLPLRDARDRRLRAALDAAWRELGVEQVRSGWTGLRRTIPAG